MPRVIELLPRSAEVTFTTGQVNCRLTHLGLTAETSPRTRGFERSFTLMHGGGGHFSDLGLLADTPRATYRRDGKPFFAYLSYSAPHWPLQAPEESIAKYHGRYDEGYEVLFEQRLEKLRKLGFIDASVSGQPLSQGEPHWDGLDDEAKRRSARLMEIYREIILK